MSSDDVIMFTLKNELQLYQWLFKQLEDIKNLLIVWANHVVQFCHFSFLVYQVLSIMRSQIEIEWIFSV